MFAILPKKVTLCSRHRVRRMARLMEWERFRHGFGNFLHIIHLHIATNSSGSKLKFKPILHIVI